MQREFKLEKIAPKTRPNGDVAHYKLSVGSWRLGRPALYFLLTAEEAAALSHEVGEMRRSIGFWLS